MAGKIVPEKKAFIWKTKDKELKIRSLKELLKALINIKLEQIDELITLNIKENNLLGWLEENFPKQMGLIANLKQALKEYTPQQIRESIIRDLRKAT